MEGKLRCIIKRPDERYGHVTNVSATLENLQRNVGGYLESLPCGHHSVILCDEEGKLKGREKNFRMGVGYPKDIICGDVVVIGVDENGEFCDLPFSFNTWKMMLDVWNS